MAKARKVYFDELLRDLSLSDYEIFEKVKSLVPFKKPQKTKQFSNQEFLPLIKDGDYLKIMNYLYATEVVSETGKVKKPKGMKSIRIKFPRDLSGTKVISTSLRLLHTTNFIPEEHEFVWLFCKRKPRVVTIPSKFVVHHDYKDIYLETLDKKRKRKSK